MAIQSLWIYNEVVLRCTDKRASTEELVRAGGCSLEISRLGLLLLTLAVDSPIAALTVKLQAHWTGKLIKNTPGIKARKLRTCVGETNCSLGLLTER